jgi:flagellar basal-body rod protein FlgG
MLMNNRQSDTIERNIENINTPGYRMEKEKATSFPRTLVSRLTTSPSGSDPAEKVRLGIMGTGVYSEKMLYCTEPGKIRETGRNTDLALNSPGYFVVDTLQGERYTRNGHFELDPSGMLRTSGGNLVLGENGPIGPLSGEFRIKQDGTVVNVEVLTVDNEDGTTSDVNIEKNVDKLRIVDILAEDLERDGLTTLFERQVNLRACFR